MTDPATYGDRIRAAVDELYAAVALVDDYLATLDSFEDRLEFYGYLTDALLELRAAVDVAGSACADRVPDRFTSYPVPGGGVFKISGGKERKRYDNPRLASVLADRIREVMTLEKIVTEDGEVGDAKPVIDAIVKKVTAATGAQAPSFDSWRAGVLKELGINPSEYADTEETPLRARIEGRR